MIRKMLVFERMKMKWHDSGIQYAAGYFLIQTAICSLVSFP